MINQVVLESNINISSPLSLSSLKVFSNSHFIDDHMIDQLFVVISRTNNEGTKLYKNSHVNSKTGRHSGKRYMKPFSNVLYIYEHTKILFVF